MAKLVSAQNHRKEKCTSADFDSYLKKTVIFSLIACMEYSISSIWENINGGENLRIIIIFLGILVIPIFVIWAWFNCIKCYLYLQISMLAEENKILQRIWIYIGIIVMICLGGAVWDSFKEMVDYITGAWKIVDGLYDCVSIKVGIFVGWLLCFMCSIWGQRIFRTKGKNLIKIVTILLLLISAIYLIKYEESKEKYIVKQTNTIWVEKMIEYYREYGDDVSIEPFSLN